MLGVRCEIIATVFFRRFAYLGARFAHPQHSSAAERVLQTNCGAKHHCLRRPDCCQSWTERLYELLTPAGLSAMMACMTTRRPAAHLKGSPVRPRAERLVVRRERCHVGSLMIDLRVTGCVVLGVGADGRGRLDVGLEVLWPTWFNVKGSRHCCRVAWLSVVEALGLAPFPDTKNQKTKCGRCA